MDSSGETYLSKNFQLENGVILPEVQVRYSTFGKLNDTYDNILVVCHALTGNSRLDTWWGSMLGPGLTFDTSKYLVVCANVLGSCYGSTGPTTINSNTNTKYGNDFPAVTIRDTVNAHMMMIKNAIGAKGIECVIGGSMGGMQALEWAIMGGDFVKKTVVIGCGAAHTAWQIAISETQRQAIYADPKWNDGNVDMSNPPTKGLSVARQIAMLSYRTPIAYQKKFGRQKDDNGIWQAKKYLEYQGTKFLERFDPVSYIKITEQMDMHDVGRNRGGIEKALSQIKGRCLVVGIDSDILYPLHEQEELAQLIPNAKLSIIKSSEGHDGFLLEQSQLAEFIDKFLN